HRCCSPASFPESMHVHYDALPPTPSPTVIYFFFFLTIPPPPTPTLFPYTTLFRSRPSSPECHKDVQILQFSPPSKGKRLFPVLRSEEHTSELQSRFDLVCRLLLEKKNSPLSQCDEQTQESLKYIKRQASLYNHVLL